MSLGVIILLIVLGLIFVLLEILVVPGVGIVGIAGGLFIVAAIYGAYAISMFYGHIALVSSLVLSVLSIYLSLKSKTWKSATLSVSTEGKVNEINQQEIHVGDLGISVSRLAMVGKAKFNNKIYEVESLSGYVDAQQSITVTKVNDYKIFVKAVV